MSVPAAYLGVILIWSTTPLAIQWSSAGWGFLFGISGRMLLGALVCAVLLLLLKPKLLWHRQARHTYYVAGLSIYGAMISVYWGAQFMPSGLIAVLYGLSPLITGLIAAFWLGEKSLTPGKLLGMALGLMGLLGIFASDIVLAGNTWQGVAAVLFSVFLHSLSAVWIKRIGSQLSGLHVTSGGLFVVAPLFLLTWLIFDGRLPHYIVPQAGMAMLYLGVFGSVLGFTLYFYVLKHLETNRVALITLVTPVLALILGQTLNGEIISAEIGFGSALIISGLGMHVWGDRLVERLSSVWK
jgi:drug/metabolite transporter (DMT)-like permease